MSAFRDSFLVFGGRSVYCVRIFFVYLFVLFLAGLVGVLFRVVILFW